MKFFKLFIISLLIVPIFACSAKSTATSGTNTANTAAEDILSNKEFNFEKYPSIMIGFRNGGVYGYALINTYMGRYKIISDTNIRLSYMAYTKVDGSDEFVEGEFEYFSALEKAKTYSYDKEKGILMIGGLKFIEKK